MKNPKKMKRNNSEVYSGTYEHYVRYRPSIPEEVVNIIVKHFGIEPDDRILDIGCGIGQVALAMEGKCGEIVCLDPDAEMLKWAEKATKGSKTKLSWINCSAEDLGKLKENLGVFKVVTCSRAFHRMNQDQVLKDLDDLIEEGGGVAVFSDRVLWGGDEEWKQAVKRVIQKYLREKSPTGKKKPIKPDELWENIIARSAFRFVKTRDVPVVRNWDIKSIMGYILSTAAAAPHLFGDQLPAFKRDIRETLLSLNPKGVFQEKAVWSIVLGSRKPRN